MVCVVGCDGADSGGPKGATDASASDDGAVDMITGWAGPVPQNKPKLCTKWSDFGSPTAVTVLNTADGDEFPNSFSADGLTVYFSSNSASRGAQSYDIFKATRSSVNDPWGNVVRVDSICTAAAETDFWVGQNDQVAFFSRNPPTTQVFYTTRSTPTGAWINPTSPLPALRAGMSDNLNPVLSYDGLELHVTSGRPGGLGLYDVWRFRRVEVTDTWLEAEHLGKAVNSGYVDAVASISADGLELFGTGTSGGEEDMWRVTRPTIYDFWDTYHLIIGSGYPLATSDKEMHPVISADGKTMFYATDKDSGTAKFEIYQTSRTCLD